MKKILSMLLIAAFILTCFPLASLANAPDAADDSDTEDSQAEPTPHEAENKHYLPGNMRGVVLRPDNKLIPDDTFDEIVTLGMNTVIIATSDNNKIFYNTDVNKSDEPDIISAAIKSAQERGLNVYLIFDVNTVFNKRNRSDWSVNLLINEIHKFTLKYQSDGIVLDSYYSVRGEETFKRYMGFGAGIGYENWLYYSTESFIKTAADTIRLTDNSVPVGIMLRDVWANYDENKLNGSITESEFQAYYDGFADTKSFVENGYADFSFVNAPDALTDASVDIPFDKITDYWGEICKSEKIPMYIVHHNQRIGSESTGWNFDDQLLRQLSTANNTPAYNGSVFYSFPDLLEDRLSSTTTMRAFFNDQINEETLFDDLVMHSPTSLSFVTNDSIAVFQGSYDDNFDVFLNDDKIALNDAGNFYIEKPLNVGVNRFTLKHKGKVVTYSIERRVVVLHSIDGSIANGKTLEVEGGTTISISAIAYRGAHVTATINGQTVSMTQRESNLDDVSLNASYALFMGRYKVPEGKIGQSQNLGNIRVTASLSGYVQNATGASIRVLALPEPPPVTPLNHELFDQDSAGSGEVVGRIDPVRKRNQDVRYVRTNENNTVVFSSKTTGTEHDPDISRLPARTIDYYSSKAGNFYTTENGKRIHVDDAQLISGKGMGDNNLVVLAGGTQGRNSFFRISLDHRSSFNIRAAGMSYTTGPGGDFNVANFNATHIHIDFDNVTSVTKLPSFEHNQVFSGGRWETFKAGGIPKFRLVLQLRRQGVYAGNFARYNDNGELMLTFRNMGRSLAGMNIVIDPGHGKTATGHDPGAIGHVREWDVNIAMAKRLRDRLNSLGANAQILRTDTTFYTTRNRNDYARNLFNCDMFISLHCNAVSGNANAKGTEVWYFTPFSQPLAREISANVAKYFQNNVYKDKVSRNRGAKYSYYMVTLAQDFPSVLVEMGFVTNMEDAMALNSNTHQAGIARAIADGIVTYVNR
jgi:N-acetylmuramoyl-L-alanine amidase